MNNRPILRISTFVILVVAVLSAEAAPPGKNKNTSTNIVVTDSGNATIGEIVGIPEHPIRSAYIVMDPSFTNGDSTVIAIVDAVKLRGTGEIVYEGAGCAGIAWVAPVLSGSNLTGNLFPYTGVGVSGATQILYKAASDTPQTVLVNSYYDAFTPTCRDFEVGGRVLQGVYPQTIAVNDLSQFVPPFRMVNP